MMISLRWSILVKPTNFDSPEPEWKYLVHLLTKKNKERQQTNQVKTTRKKLRALREHAHAPEVLPDETNLPAETKQEQANPMLPQVPHDEQYIIPLEMEDNQVYVQPQETFTPPMQQMTMTQSGWQIC